MSNLDELIKLAGLGIYKGRKIAIGLSGGVDSAVSTYLLKAAGADVKAVFMKNWAGEAGLGTACPWEEDLASAMEVAQYLDVEFESVNFEKEYKQRVLDNFFSEYESGRTPNPDILCNSEIKFKAFLNYAIDEGFDQIATGHYAKVGKSTLLEGVEGYFLHTPTDKTKNQTYFLSGLNQGQLARAVFPLANLTKEQVRSIAKLAGLPNARRPDSQGICFVGDIDVRNFLREHLEQKKGNIVDIDTNQIVGEHSGIFLYTIGQREGLNIGGLKRPYYVVAKSLGENIVYVAAGRDHRLLNRSTVSFSNIEFQHPKLGRLAADQLNILSLSASIRYRQSPVGGTLSDDKLSFSFNEKQWGISPGQSIVFCTSTGITIGRAIISEAL